MHQRPFFAQTQTGGHYEHHGDALDQKRPLAQVAGDLVAREDGLHFGYATAAGVRCVGFDEQAGENSERQRKEDEKIKRDDRCEHAALGETEQLRPGLPVFLRRIAC